MDVRRAPRWLFLLSTSTLMLGVIASLSTGWFRRLLLLLMLGVALGIVFILRGRGVDEVRLGGAGYDRPAIRGTRILHVMSNILYAAGIMVVVFAALVRTGLVDVAIDPLLVHIAPMVTGLFLWLLALSTLLEVRRGAEPATPWIMRGHEMFVWAVGGVIGLFLLWLLFDATLTVAGATLLQATDMPVLLLVAVLGIGTHVLLASGTPTALDLLMQAFDRSQRNEKGETPPILYAAVLSVLLASVLAFIASQFDLFGAIGRFQDDRVVYIVAVVPLSLIAFFANSALAIWREGRRGLYRKRLPPDLKADLIVYGASGALGLVGFIGLVMALNERLPGIPGLSEGQDIIKDLVAFTIIVTLGPIGVYLHRKHQALDNLEARLPDLLNDLAESRRAGLTLATALQAAAKTDYGTLTPEVQKMATQVAWGVSFTDVLQQFAGRVKSNLVRRTTQLVIESSRTGGSITQVLKAAARDAYEIKALEADRRVTMATYLIVIYVVFFVFMVVLAALDTQFIPGVIEAQNKVNERGSGLEGGLGSGGAGLDQEAIQFVYFNAAMIQALGNGIVGGVLSEGRVTAGFRHVAIMALSSWFTFRLLLGIL